LPHPSRPESAAPAADTLEVERLVAGGEGLARRTDGRVVFVSRAAPGERVEVAYTEWRREWARARVTSVLAPSPERREPPCPHYATCGGCQLQHLAYDAQRAAKAAIVADALRRVGGVEAAPPEVVAAPHEFGYRNRLSFVLRRRGGHLVAGFHAHGAPAQVHDIDACPLAEAPLARAWASLRGAWGPRAARLPDGPELRLTLRATADGRVGLAVEHGRGRGAPEALLETVTGLASVWGIDGAGRVRWQAGEPTLAERWGAAEIPLAGLAFVQVNREAAAALDAHVGAVCGEAKPGRAVDAYCGFGLRSLALARAGVETVGIDVDAHAIAWANDRAADEDLPARFQAARVERALVTALPNDLVVLNPPRAGVSREVAVALVRRPAGRVVYVSCNPATLGRDVRALSERYALVSCRAFDLFPQTAHVETVAVLERR